ncbi:hypothetical protein WDV06_29405 [Streptomyces racemochromogenes]|uniref:Serine protease n=1 Tax=Streptomyces racemochromogenes TaxID=67353 RepID=A0ABW7PL96_9ACTN
MADDRGTVLTGHEAVEGLARIELCAPGGRTWWTGADEVIGLPELGLALVPSDGLGLRPLPVAACGSVLSGTYVRVLARGWRQARVLGAGAEVSHTAAGRRWLLPATLELAIGTDGRDALRLGGAACGGPVLDAETGAVLAVVGTALTAERRSGSFAVPLREAAATAPGGPLAALLERNAATVPAYGADLNLAGVLELTATTLGSALPAAGGGGPGPEPAARPAIAAGLAAFTAGQDLILGLVGDPGTGRTTALATLAADRARGPRPAPSLWLRGADLRPDDTSLADAVTRSLAEAARVTATATAAWSDPAGAGPARAGVAGDTVRVAGTAGMAGAAGAGGVAPGFGGRAGAAGLAGAGGDARKVAGVAGAVGAARGGEGDPAGGADASGAMAERVARLAAAAGRALLVVLDAPEEMPPGLAHRLAPWTVATAAWLCGTGARLVVAARPEYWERAGALWPPELLHTPERSVRRLPPALPVGDLTPAEAETARARLGIPPDAVREADARHPLTLGLLAGLRAAGVTGGRPTRDEVFAAHLDLLFLRAAVRIAADPHPIPAPRPGGPATRAAGGSPGPAVRGAASRSDAAAPRDVRGGFSGPAAPAPRHTPWGSPPVAGGAHREGPAGSSGPAGGSHPDGPTGFPFPTERCPSVPGPRQGAHDGATATGAGPTASRVEAPAPGNPLVGRWTAEGRTSGSRTAAGRSSAGGRPPQAPSGEVPRAAAPDGAERSAPAGARSASVTAGSPYGSWSGTDRPSGVWSGADDASPAPRPGADRLSGSRPGTDGPPGPWSGADGSSGASPGADGPSGVWSPADRSSGPSRGADRWAGSTPGVDGWSGGGDGLSADAAGGGDRLSGVWAGAGAGRAPRAGGGEDSGPWTRTDGARGPWPGAGRASGSGGGPGGRDGGERPRPDGRGAGDRGGEDPGGPVGGQGDGAPAAGVYGPGVRRLAARVAGRVHEAARRCLGPGQGQLDRAAFEELFPWRTGWASAVLTEGLLVPAGPGYRFAHEELSDWLQACHLDVPRALDTLVHSGPATPGPPVPRHRIGPVLEALRRLPDAETTEVLARLVGALNDFAEAPPGDVHPDRVWWAARLLRGTLLRAPDATPYLPVLHALAEHVARAGPEDFGGWFWNRLRLSEPDRLDLLRRLLPSDHRYLEAAGRRLTRAPQLVMPLVCAWFTDERRLRGRPGATVATAAQALLHTHRRLALDDLTEALVDAAHPRADELLAVLAEDEPSALSRAVDRWAHDERPGRRVAAAAYGLATAPHVRAPADRELLRFAAEALLARPGDLPLHGSALGILLRDPQARARHLTAALDCFRDPERGSRLPASALVAALPVLPDPDAVFDALRARADGEVLRALAALTTPALARRAGDLVREHLARHPADAPHAAAFVDRRLEQGPAAAPVLRPLVLGLLRGAPPQVRSALAGVLAAPGGEPTSALRTELAETLLREEPDPRVLGAFLTAVAAAARTRPEDRTRELLRRTGRQLLRIPGGPEVFEQRTVELVRADPVFGALVARWLAEARAEAAALLGPGARRTVESLSRSAPDVT